MMRRGDRLVLFEGEFPANVTPWQRAAALFDLTPRFVPVARFAASDAEGLAALESELRLINTSLDDAYTHKRPDSSR